MLTGGPKMIDAGIAIGLASAFLLSRFLASLLFGVGPLDPVAFLAAAAGFAMVAPAACALPAWRALRVDPSLPCARSDGWPIRLLRRPTR